MAEKRSGACKLDHSALGLAPSHNNSVRVLDCFFFFFLNQSKCNQTTKKKCSLSNELYYLSFLYKSRVTQTYRNRSKLLYFSNPGLKKDAINFRKNGRRLSPRFYFKKKEMGHTLGLQCLKSFKGRKSPKKKKSSIRLRFLSRWG